MPDVLITTRIIAINAMVITAPTILVVFVSWVVIFVKNVCAVLSFKLEDRVEYAKIVIPIVNVSAIIEEITPI